MNYITKYTGALLVLALFFASCKKDRLETSPSDKVTKDVVFETTEGGYVALNGMHRMMYSFALGDPDYGGHDDFGQKSNDIANDVMGEDMVVIPPASYNWFNREYNYTALKRVGTSDRPSLVWNFYYKIINNANNIIAQIDAATGSEEDKANIKGQAYAYRAYCYYNLSLYYAHTYAGHQDDKCVPIYTEPTTGESQGAPRSSVEAVYDLITSDLDQALELLAGSSSTDKSQIGEATVKGIYARVALVMNNWALAQQYANEARAGFAPMSAAQYTSGFNDVTNPEVMWGSDVNNEQNTVLASYYSHLDPFAGGYAGLVGMYKAMNKSLYDLIPDGDVRKDVFAAVDNEDGLPAYTNLKFLLANPSSWASDYMYMRSAEMYLIEAEAAARSGADAIAKSILEELISTRFDGYSAPTGGAELLNEILLQRRIELWGEGFRYSDIQRLKIPLNRTGGSHTASLALTMELPAESDKFLFVLPQKEFDANRSLTGADQNPF